MQHAVVFKQINFINDNLEHNMVQGINSTNSLCITEREKFVQFSFFARFKKLHLLRLNALGFPKMMATELLVQQNDSADVLTTR